jgi:hypothetical protein
MFVWDFAELRSAYYIGRIMLAELRSAYYIGHVTFGAIRRVTLKSVTAAAVDHEGRPLHKVDRSTK